ncbi:MAG TPA: LemA family protein [Patescibacteria group bacterium]|nr:LemA family protein [Patescibacteria group bacterium]
MIWIIGIVVFLAFVIFATYNSLITAKVRVGEAFSQIDVQLKRRTDLIPNLVETVKGYAKHEKSVFEEVTKARASLMGAKTVEDKAKANSELASTLKSLFAVAENYPTLKASDNFAQLQETLSDTEDKIAYARQFYNSVVMDYNTKLSVFPTVIFANMMRFEPAQFFAATAEEKKEISVKF